MFKEAVAELEKAREFLGSSPSGLGDLGMAYALSGEAAKAKEVLSLLEDYMKRDYPVNAEIALVHLGLGDKEKALEWLDRASDDDNEIAYLVITNTFKLEPLWDGLRPDPRFVRLMKKLHLE